MSKVGISVSMNGEEYLKYLDGKKMSKGFKRRFWSAAPYFIMSFVAFVFLVALSADLFVEQSVQKPIFSTWYDVAPSMVDDSWSDIGKFVVVYFAPFLVIVIGIAWLLHGFGFLLVKG